MGRKELALALQQKGEAEAEAIWQQVEAEVDRYRQQRQQEVARRSADSGRQADRSAVQECLHVDWLVTKTARALRLKTLRELDRRLWQLACEEIKHLEPLQRQQSLDDLLTEIPGIDWQSITVHPDDVKAAKKGFPGRRLLTDVGLGGGLLAETAAGKVRIDNSLKKRLENSWPVLVGRMLAELEMKVGDEQ